MSEEQIEWRDAWNKLIAASKNSVLGGTIEPFDELTTLQDDKMLLFEKAIALECMSKKNEAKEFYKQAADEKTGLPVRHWRKRAKYFLNRLDRGGFMTSDLNLTQDIFNIQWDVYFNIHYYANLDDYIRYLAISSVSRIGSEPAMAIVIFRTCLEIGLWTYFEKEANLINEDYKRKHYKKDGHQREIGLNDLLDCMNEKPYNLFKKNEFKVYDKVRIAGNAAAHPGTLKDGVPFHYTEEQLRYIMNDFNEAMRYLDSHAHK